MEYKNVLMRIFSVFFRLGDRHPKMLVGSHVFPNGDKIAEEYNMEVAAIFHSSRTHFSVN